MPEAIKEMVEYGLDINARVLSGTFKGMTPYDLAKTETLRNFVRDLGGAPSGKLCQKSALQ